MNVLARLGITVLAWWTGLAAWWGFGVVIDLMAAYADSWWAWFVIPPLFIVPCVVALVSFSLLGAAIDAD